MGLVQCQYPDLTRRSCAWLVETRMMSEKTLNNLAKQPLFGKYRVMYDLIP
jgi:hypothetical protein